MLEASIMVTTTVASPFYVLIKTADFHKPYNVN